MPYIGRDTDKISNVEVLDNITFDGSSSYTLQKGGSNFTPSSANTLLLSIDGVVQAGNFTVSGSTIDFGTAVAGTSTCDFILHYGVGLITTVSDGTVTTAKLADSSVTTAKLNDASVSLAKLTATGTKDATTFLRGDNTFNSPSVASLSTASGSAPSYSARAWVNFDGDGTVSVRGSANVSSVTDQGTGDYTVNFSTAMSDTNFSCVGSSGLSAGSDQTYLQLDKTVFTESGSAQVACRGETNNRTDSNLVCVGIFR
jgi:hypothetical protein